MLVFGNSRLKCLLHIQVEILHKSTIQAFMDRAGSDKYLGVTSMYVLLRPWKWMQFPRGKV